MNKKLCVLKYIIKYRSNIDMHDTLNMHLDEQSCPTRLYFSMQFSQDNVVCICGHYDIGHMC